MDVEILETAAKAIIIIVGSIVSIHQLISRLPKSRASLKEDLEILKMIDENGLTHKNIRSHINNKIIKIYGSMENEESDSIESEDEESSSTEVIGGSLIKDWRSLALGIAFLAIFIPWTMHLFDSGNLLWIITGFLIISGLGNILIGIDGKRDSKS